ncbi:MAG: putative ABC transporter permease [Ruminococcus sp.]|nr:putative ABC transporter permease [Ruminococcus sp.]
MNLTQYFLAFMAYGFIGWVYESILYTIQERRLILSGFLYGPCCPIYGGGAVIMVFFFYGRTDNPWLMFFGGMALATVVEYFTAVIMENVFHKKWWDYSKIKYNFQGRICLLGAVCFGTLCLMLCEFVHPVFEKKLAILSEDMQFYIAVVLAVLFLIDYIATVVNLKIKKKNALENDEVYENKLPQLDIGLIYESVGLKKRIDPIKEKLIKKFGR